MGPTLRRAALLIGILAVPAAAEPRAQSSGALTFSAVAVDDSDRPALDLAAEIHLEQVRLSGFAASGGGTSLGYGQIGLGDLRLGGGIIRADGDDADWGLHLGYSPRARWRPRPWLEVRGRLDVAIGGGGLGASRAADPSASLPDTLDLYAGSLGLGLDVVVRPLSWAQLQVGVAGDLLAIGAPPRADPGPVASLLGAGAEVVDVGLSSALSEGAVGAYAQVDLRLLGRGADAVKLSYREAWDWIHLDPLHGLTRATRVAGDLLRLAPTPVRTTRAVALRWRQRGEGWGWSGGVEGRHVRDSTTALDFADRNGWSVAAWLGADAGRWSAAVSARYHLQAADLERYLGEWPRYRVAGQVGARLAGGREAGLRLETGAQWTLSDALGLPRSGVAVFAQLSVWFGGPRPVRDPIEDGALPYVLRSSGLALARRIAPTTEPPPAQLDLPSRAEVLAQAPQARPALEAFLAEVPAGERAAILADGRAIVAEDGLTARSASRLLERRPDLAERIERHFPGLLGATGLSQPGPTSGALVTGYGRGGLRLGAVDRVTRYAITERTDRVASDLGVTARAPDLLKAGPRSLPSPFEHSSLSAFVQPGQVDAFSLFVPDGRRYRLLAQVRSRWTRFLQRSLTGR